MTTDGAVVTRMRCDVAAAGVRGVDRLVADVFHPVGAPTGAVLICTPGGGMSRRYFDLETDGYSMARHLAAAGHTVVTLDPPNVGESDPAGDPYDLTPDAVARVLALAVDGVLGQVDGVRAVIGVGHSAGALLTVLVHAHARPFDALALLGFHGAGLPAALGPAEMAVAGDPAVARAALPELVRARFGTALPVLRTAVDAGLAGGTLPAEARVAMQGAAAPLLGLVGLASMIPGFVSAELEELEVPVFLAVGERDITAPVESISAEMPAATLTAFTLPGSGHNHNVSVNRVLLWDRLDAWVRTVVAP